MKRAIIAALALALLLGLQPKAARAQGTMDCGNNLITWLAHGRDCRLFWGGVGIGAAAGVTSYYLTKKHGYPATRPMSFAAAWGVTAYGCAVAYPFVGTWLLNRPLTPREMYLGVAGCVVPVIGPWLVDAALPHDAWTDGTPAHH